jgi:hypothetical protein
MVVSYSAARGTSAFCSSSWVTSAPISFLTMAPAVSVAMALTPDSARVLGLLDAGLGLGDLAGDLGLDPGPLLVDLGGQAVAHRLDDAAGLGACFGQRLLIGR